MSEGQVNEESNGKKAVPHHRCAAMGSGKVYIFLPQEDITTFELALSMELVVHGIGVMVRGTTPDKCDELYSTMPPQTQRHWLVREVSQVVGVQRPNRIQLPPGMR